MVLFMGILDHLAEGFMAHVKSNRAGGFHAEIIVVDCAELLEMRSCQPTHPTGAELWVRGGLGAYLSEITG